MAAHPGMENPSERVPYKTWLLKVSIHCEGCKKKVRKVIQTIEGVYTVDIDIKQNRVVVTGNVEGDALVRKLIKSGKNAELWPQIAPPLERKPRALKKKEMKIDPEPSISQEVGHGGAEADKLDKRVEAVHEPAKISGGGAGGAPEKGESSASAVPEGHGDGGATLVKSDGGGGAAQNRDPLKNRDGGCVAVKSSDDAAEISVSGEPAVKPKAGGTKPEVTSAAKELPAKATATATAVDNGGKGVESAEPTQPSHGGGVGKKKKKKGQKQTSSVIGESSSVPAPASRGLPHHNSVPPEFNPGRPRHHGYEYPPHYYTPPPPVATVSYSTAYPTSYHTTSYYTAPPPYSHAYAYPRPETETPPLDLEPYPPQPLDSFELFSDENPNGCFIM